MKTFCAMGKVASEHEGNRRFRAMVRAHLQNYSASSCKYHKFRIVSHNAESSRFVKPVDEQCYAVPERCVSEKIGQVCF